MDIYQNTAIELKNRIFEPCDIKGIAEVSYNRPDIHGLMNLLLEKAMLATKAQIGSVCIFESDNERLHIIASKDLEAKPKKDFFINLNESLIEIVVNNRKPFLVKDIETDFRTRRPNNPKYGLPSFIIMPICAMGDLIGVMNLAHKKNKQKFSSDDVLILSTLIDEVGISLENVYLHSTVDKYLKNYQESIAKLNIANRQLNHEITRRWQLQAALQESTARCSNILESIEEGFFEVDLDGNMIFFNNSLCKMTGYSADELMGTNIRRYIAPGTAERLFNVIKNINRSGISPVLIDCEFISKNKTIYPFILSSCLKNDQEGRPVGLYGIVHDVSRYLRAEREKEKLESQLRQAQKMEAVGTLAGGIAHDFNNMLQAITGNTQILLMQKKSDEPDYSKLKSIERAAMRASDLTRQLLLFGRQADSNLEPVNLNYEIKNILKLLKHTIPKMIDIELKIEKLLNNIKANPVQIEQIIMNLAVNARDAMPDGGKLIFKTENVIVDKSSEQNEAGITPGEYVLFTISDTGHGIDKNLLEHIFKPFYTTKHKEKGTGLGLAMVYSIVKKANGHIICESEVGQGTSFKIYFPGIKSDVIEVKRENTWAEQMPRGTETILLVDDERALLDIGREMLGRFGYTTIETESGEKALEIYRKEKDRIDLIILDLGMPGMGGYKCFKKLLEIDPQVKVIISSGYSAAEKVRETLELGAVEFIEKPYLLGEVLKKLRYVLEREQEL